MKVYFTCTTAEFKRFHSVYSQIRDYLISQKHTLTRDWLPETEDRLESGDTAIDDIKQIYQKCIQAIHDADLVVVEDTVSNFSTGHQISIALQRQKPTLVLWQGQKHSHFQKMFIHGVESDYLEVKQYTAETLEKILGSFLKKYEFGTAKTRFHLVLDRLERDYLDWAQYNHGKSRTRLIRDALRQYIGRDDDYKEYLEKDW